MRELELLSVAVLPNGAKHFRISGLHFVENDYMPKRIPEAWIPLEF